MAFFPRRHKVQDMDMEAAARSLAELDARLATKAAQARAELDALMRRVVAGLKSPPVVPAGLRQFTLRLEAWQVTAARLLAAVRRAPCQERMRDWITVGLLADWRAMKSAARKRR